MSPNCSIFAADLKKYTLIVSALLSVMALSAMTREEMETRVDSAYNAAMAGQLELAISINMDGLAAVPADSMSWKCEFYSCLLYCYHRLGDYQQALYYGEECLHYDEQQGQPQDLSASLGNLAGIYSSAGRQDVAEEYLRRAIDIEQQLLKTEKEYSPKSLAVRQAMLGEVLLSKSDALADSAKTATLREALSLTEQALQTDRALGRRLQEGMRLAQLGHIYEALEQPALAGQYTTEALLIARETGNKMTEVLCLLQLGQYREAADRAHEFGFKKQEYEACDRLYERAKAAGRNAEALQWLERVRVLYDTLQNEDTHRQLAIAQVAYDTYRKERQLAEQQQLLALKQARERILVLMLLLLILIVALLTMVAVLLRRRKREIEAVAAYRERQYSILAHDLTNPMVAQQQVLRMLFNNHDSQTPEQLRTILGQLLASSDNQLALLRNLSEFTRLQQGQRPMTPTRLDLSSIAVEMIAAMKSIADLKGIRIINRCDHLYVMADRDTLRTILRNLISNAVKFSPKESEIEIGTETPNSLYVRDKGCGMTPERINEILHSSARVEPTIGTNGESGTGIGLLLCRELIRLNKGTLDIRSGNGQTTFSLSLPAAEQTENER